MNTFKNNEFIIFNDEGLLDAIKSFFQMLRAVPIKIQTKLKSNLKNNFNENTIFQDKKEFNEEERFYKIVNQLIDMMDLLSYELYTNYLFNNELTDFLDIKYITEYTLKQEFNKISDNNIVFLNDLSYLFLDLIQKKIELIKENNNDQLEDILSQNYSTDYEKFKTELKEYKEEFYDKIFVLDEKSKKSIINLSNALKE
ncbi:MAG: hypothetical protein LBM96_01595 [Methanobrevibacter sp.]|jgi:hypothetical protein|nr:hypothetical protein [Candidatus Methanoflexus mossambicus]